MSQLEMTVTDMAEVASYTSKHLKGCLGPRVSNSFCDPYKARRPKAGQGLFAQMITYRQQK